MLTRKRNFLNTATQTPEYSFQYFHPQQGWQYGRSPAGEPARWASVEHRDSARACFTSRRTPERAQADLDAFMVRHPSL